MRRQHDPRRDARQILNHRGEPLVDSRGVPLRRGSRSFNTDDRFTGKGPRLYPYKAAEWSNRTRNWWRGGYGDAPGAAAYVLEQLRWQSRDLVRNNEVAESAINFLIDQIVGAGIRSNVDDQRWREWSTTPACDSVGRKDLAMIQALAVETAVQSGECIVRRRWRKRRAHTLPLPFQLQVLEPDHLASTYYQKLPNGHTVSQGIEYDQYGRPHAYYLYREHPGSHSLGGSNPMLQLRRASGTPDKVPAADVAHLFLERRPNQVRGVPWFAPLMMRVSDLDEFIDATLVKGQVAAHLAVLTVNPDGTQPEIGVESDDEYQYEDDPPRMLHPGSIVDVAPGRDVRVVEPSDNKDYDPYTRSLLRLIAAAIGCTYEGITGDYSSMNYSSARASNNRHWKRIERLRHAIMVIQFLRRLEDWAREAAMLSPSGAPLPAEPWEWNGPPRESADPEKETNAQQRRIRTGMSTPSRELRQIGIDPAQHWQEYADDLKTLDRLGIVLDIDARKLTQQGQIQQDPASGAGDPEADAGTGGTGSGSGGDDDAGEAGNGAGDAGNGAGGEGDGEGEDGDA